MQDNAIVLNHITKIYKLYDHPMDRLKETFDPSGKKRHKEHYALRDVSFSVKRGECIGIIGTNGSGKSTVLKIITGVLNKTGGDLQVNGRISALLELGAGFNMEYTGIENIYLNGIMIGFSKEEIDEKMEDILSFADIGDFVYQPVRTYSSGMFVRLAFAVAINIDPEILVVDEALSVGDVFFQIKCYKKFEEFKQAGKTILFVSHDLSSISRYCDRVVLLNKGHKLMEGPPRKVIDIYKKLLVNQLEVTDGRIVDKPLAGEKKTGIEVREGLLWREQIKCNPDINEYGEKQGEIFDFAIFDREGKLTNLIEKGSEFSIRMKIRAHERILEPIAAFTILNIKGTQVTGTNTMYEGRDIEVLEDGDEIEVSFRQRCDIQGGEYVISFGLTGYRNGEFYVYHRLYEAVNLTVVSVKNTVGFFDMNSEVELIESGRKNEDDKQ